jgi:hypothetical protein
MQQQETAHIKHINDPIPAARASSELGNNK